MTLIVKNKALVRTVSNIRLRRMTLNEVTCRMCVNLRLRVKVNDLVNGCCTSADRITIVVEIYSLNAIQLLTSVEVSIMFY